ncbi:MULTISPECIES: serine hydrolase domain-containing protein [Bacillus cereus group]|uniref:serine hydrolase domain-containing protein n=1 Tax=Bacillus cereus group TaxID=86661 RepID=UPI0005C89DCE|nr:MULTISPECIES: serine hydrolase domain-containing protein [Bacillus cereus group]KIZ30178.1 penicillin-binding protein [Bacillus cereus]MBJ8127388.1 beta-lactamase family protein [Bacillus cereus]PFO23195.1 penicillin-binding protein [Bacillus thuringiensis]PGB56559.1 penicillin-binding protein [Bacillus anthracis]
MLKTYFNHRLIILLQFFISLYIFTNIFHLFLDTKKVSPYFKDTIQIKKKANQPSKYEVLTQRLDQYLKDNAFNGSVLVTIKDHVILRKAYGYANIQDNVLATPKTKYRIGSITKTVVAVSIMQLQEQGRLDIDENVNKYVSTFPAEKQITLRHLLTHTSGLPEQGQGNVDTTSHLKLINWIGSQKLEFPPGTGWRYTDYNYMVLGYIVEKISKRPLSEYINEHIFNPADMKESGIGKKMPEDIFLAEGYRKEKDSLVPAQRLQMKWLYGCGDMYTTVDDMKKLDEAIMAEKLISKKGLSEIFTVSQVKKYGFGFYIHPDYYHNHGVLSGWNTYNNFNWDKRIFVILFSNVKNSMDDEFNQKFRSMVMKIHNEI